MRFLFVVPFFQCALGQLLPELDPSLPRGEELESVAAMEAFVGRAEEGAVLTDTLKKVVLVSWANVATVHAADHLAIGEGLILPDARKLSAKLSPWIGRPVREGDLVAMADVILAHYDQHGYPVVSVDVPEQELDGGVLNYVVELGVIGKVGVTNPSYSDAGAIREGLWLREGDVIRRGELDAQMDWFGRNIFRRPRLLVSPGMEPPSADILIALTERKPWIVSLGYENSGHKAIGRDHFIIGAAAMTRNEHVIAWQTVLGYPVSSLQAHAATWEIPFHAIHQTLQLSGSIALVETDNLVAGLPVGNKGESWGVSAIQKIPLPSLGNWKQSMHLGIELKSTDQFVLFGGTGLSPGEVRFLNLGAGYSFSRKWKHGGFSVEASLSGSPGGLVSKNDDADFKNYDPEADSSYVIGRMSTDGWWTPGGDWRLRIRAEGQVSDSRLLPAEQIAGGGHRSVRGVGEREYSTDTGYHGSFEIYGPAVSLGSDSGLRFLAFYDQAWLRDRGGESVSLSGAGIGVRAKLAPHIDLRIDQGWRLDEAGSTTHVGLRAEF